jgi:hypothetical protein
MRVAQKNVRLDPRPNLLCQDQCLSGEKLFFLFRPLSHRQLALG